MTEVPDILTVHAANHPEKPALICGDEVLTYREYDERSNRAARSLIDRGVEPGDRVAVMAYNSVAGSVVSAGLRKAHAVNVPVNFRLHGSELAYVVNDSGARAVCAGPDFVEHVQVARPQIEGRTFVALGGGSGTAPSPAPPPPGGRGGGRVGGVVARGSPGEAPPEGVRGVGAT